MQLKVELVVLNGLVREHARKPDGDIGLHLSVKMFIEVKTASTA